MHDIHVTDFIARFSAPLGAAYAKLAAFVQLVTSQTLAIPQPALHPHTHDIVTRGHEKYKNSSQGLDGYFESLRIDHIKWAAAVLSNDGPSASAFMQTIEQKVSPAIAARFRHQQFAVTAAEDLPSRILMTGQSKRPRIAEYLGRSSLESWLIGIGIKLAINEQQRRGRAAGGEDSGLDFAERPTPADAEHEGEAMEQSEMLERLRQNLYELATAFSSESESREQLVLQFAVVQRLKPAVIADCLGVSRARVSQIRSAIARNVVAREAASRESIIRKAGLDTADVEKHFWEILGASERTDL